jgi:membrane protease subunit HflK
MPWSNQGGGGGGPWGSGSGGKGPWGSGPQSTGPTPPDLEEMLRRGQDKLRRVLPGGNLGGKGFAILGLAAIALWGVSGFFRVEPDELGVVLRFGQEVREVQPGLNYHLPYPIETVLTPKALRVNKIDIGMRIVDDIRRGTPTTRDVPEESLMLTGDENIVDVDFAVLWKVKPTGVGEYLFNIQNPEGTVKAVAESAMREVVGRSEIQPILTGARQTIETAVQDLMQKTLDSYGAGILVQQVQMQKVDPPTQVIDSFRDVQAARADLERAVNEAQTYQNRVVPEAKWRRSRNPPKPTSRRPSPRRPARHRASLKSTSSTSRRPMSPASACILRPWKRFSAAPTRSSWIRGATAVAVWCLTCRSTNCPGRRSRAAQPRLEAGHET